MWVQLSHHHFYVVLIADDVWWLTLLTDCVYVMLVTHCRMIYKLILLILHLCLLYEHYLLFAQFICHVYKTLLKRRYTITKVGQ